MQTKGFLQAVTLGAGGLLGVVLMAMLIDRVTARTNGGTSAFVARLLRQKA